MTVGRRLKILFSHTGVRLSALFLALFAVSAFILTLYISAMAENLITEQTRAAIDDEVKLIDRIWEEEGPTNLLRLLDRRSRQPDAGLYVIAAPNGEILAGNVAALAPGVIGETGWIDRPFQYDRYTQDGTTDRHRAIAHVTVFENGIRILVGRDLNEGEKFGVIVRKALTLAVGIMGVGALVIWFVVGRNALNRIDRMSDATRGIVGGDLSRRLPVSGSGDEFDRMSESLNLLLNRMEKLDEGLRQVSDNIAHDLKTPLTRLRNKAEAALVTAKGTKDLRAAMDSVIAEADQIIRTFNALLMIARVESGSHAAELTPTDLSALAADTAELYEPLVEDAGLAFSTAIEPGVSISGNRELIAQALANLIDNAVKYGSLDGGSIVVTLARHGTGEVRLAVQDDGEGLPEGAEEEVVKRFVRLDASRAKPGTGLGLSLVDAVAKLHGGRLELLPASVDNGVRRGLAAAMILPVGKIAA